MKLIRRITVKLSFIGLAVCCGVVLLFSWSATGWKALSVPTSSMRPAIPRGSLVLMHRVPVSSLKAGDVITYINPFNARQTISHRIIKTYTIAGKIPAFVTKGDANKAADQPVTKGMVQGKVVWHIPQAGAWLLTAKKPGVILPVIYLAAVLIMAEEVRRLSDYYRRSQPYRVAGFMQASRRPGLLGKKLSYAGGLAAVFVVIGASLGPTVQALLQSNTVALVNNQVAVAPIRRCSSANTTIISVSDNSTQSSSSGNATSSGNTTGGSATSGNASNNSSTSTTISVSNC